MILLEQMNEFEIEIKLQETFKNDQQELKLKIMRMIKKNQTKNLKIIKLKLKKKKKNLLIENEV